MVTAVDATTALVVTVKLALLAPAGTVTLAGTAATLGLLLARETTARPVGAGALRVTVPGEDCVPPVTLVGFSVSDDRVAVGGVTVSDAVLLAPPWAAEMVTAVDATTALVVAVKLALLAPAGTVTLAGTAATLGLLLARETTAPPLGDGPLRVTVPVEDCVPPVTLVGFSVSDDRVVVGGVTVRCAVLLAPPYDAERVTAVDATTALVVA